MSPPLVVREARPDDPAALAALGGYFRDIVGRYHERPATDVDVEEALRDFPSDDLVAPTGVLLLAGTGAVVVGCAGLRWAEGGAAELTRVWVDDAARRRGVARGLLAGAERRARAARCVALWLEVRADLVEAQALYRACGYVQTTPFSDGRLHEAVFRKALEPRPG